MRLTLGRRAKRGAALVAGAAVAITAGFILGGPASAAGNLGSLTFAPPTGLDTTAINATTVSSGAAKGCPAGSTNVRGYVNGPGAWTNITIISNTSSGVSTTADFEQPISDTFSGIAQSNGLTITAGRYDITLECRNRLGSTIFGTFTAPIFFTDATHYQSTDPNGAVTTTTVVTASPVSPKPVGTAITFTATLTPATAAGKVQFKNGTAALGAAQTVTGGKAVLTTTALGVGTHAITAVFTPTNPAAFKTSTSAAISYVTTNPVATTTTLAATPASPKPVGTAITFTASLNPAGAVGKVQFKNGTAALGAAQTVTSGKAVLTTTALGVGTHSITAVFIPTNPNSFKTSTSGAISYVTTQPVATTTVVSASPASPKPAGTAITFTATLAPAGAVGKVQFKNGTAALGAAQTVTSGKAVLTTTALAKGTHSITAVFTPTNPNNFKTSTSGAISYVIS